MIELCRHFGVCGGCSSQDVPYADQLAAKQELVRKVVSPFRPKRFDPIVPSPELYYYRNKMEFVFGIGRGGVPELGMRKQGRFDNVVDLEECLLLSPETPRLLASVRTWAGNEGLLAYDLKRHAGFLRYLVVREGKNTGQRMVHLVTAPGRLPDSFVRAVEDSGVRVDSLVWSVNAAKSDVARGEDIRVLRGQGFIEDRLGDKTFRLSPTAFFQTNTRGAEKLYALVRSYLGARVGTLFDVYCGGGAIGLTLADAAERVIGVELNESAVADAESNAQRQGAANATFHAMDAAELPRREDLSALWKMPNAAAVMDPPRPGLAPALRHMMVQHPVARWVYVSCNPAALAVDLPVLSDAYELAAVGPVDLFPHTPHVETVLLLERKRG